MMATGLSFASIACFVRAGVRCMHAPWLEPQDPCITARVKSAYTPPSRLPRPEAEGVNPRLPNDSNGGADETSVRDLRSDSALEKVIISPFFATEPRLPSIGFAGVRGFRGLAQDSLTVRSPCRPAVVMQVVLRTDRLTCLPDLVEVALV